MAFLKCTDEMSDLIESIMKDVPKIHNGNKLASQRIRCATIKLSKLTKKWRRLSLEEEKMEKVKKK